MSEPSNAAKELVDKIGHQLFRATPEALVEAQEIAQTFIDTEVAAATASRDATIAGLRAELERANQANRNLCDRRWEMGDSIDSLRQQLSDCQRELSEARKDTERLDWLEAHKDNGIYACKMIPGYDVGETFGKKTHHEALRTAIDAARSQDDAKEGM